MTSLNEPSSINQGRQNGDARLKALKASLKKKLRKRWLPVLLIFVYSLGILSGYGISGMAKQTDSAKISGTTEIDVISRSTFPQDGYRIPVILGNIGSQLIEMGVINRTQFAQAHAEMRHPLSAEQMKVFDGTYAGKVFISEENSYFLLNFFWALGLANKNPILDSGLIQKYSNGEIEVFASTGGWTFASHPINEIFSSQEIIPLNDAQQKIVEEAASRIYRPCCNNPSNFPDCNHGMAMLGLIELMGSQDKNLDEMLEAAKYVAAYWFQEQTLAQAVYFKKAENKEFKDVDANRILSSLYSSASGFNELYTFILEKKWMPSSNIHLSNCGG
jgi:hypothetical protein